MTRSLPGVATANPRAATPRKTSPALERALALGTRVGVKVIPRLPTPIKRLLAGGRSVTIDGNTLDPAVQLLLLAQHAVGIDGLVVGDDPHATRALMHESMLMFAEPDVHVEVSDISIPGPAGAIGARHYRPPGDAPAPLVVFYHGGGFVFGTLDTHDTLCRLTCRDAAVQVLSVDYRLAPEHKAPAALDDAYAAYRWAVEHAGELGALPHRVAVAGDSAGGDLAAGVSQRARAAGDPLPALQWLIYPVTELGGLSRSRTLFADGFLLTKANMDWFEAQYLDGSGITATDPRVSPLLADDLSGLPPALVVTAGFDPLRDEGDQYAAGMRAAGVTVDHRRMGSLIHGFATFNALGGGCARAVAEMISAVRAHLSHD